MGKLNTQVRVGARVFQPNEQEQFDQYVDGLDENAKRNVLAHLVSTGQAEGYEWEGVKDEFQSSATLAALEDGIELDKARGQGRADSPIGQTAQVLPNPGDQSGVEHDVATGQPITQEGDEKPKARGGGGKAHKEGVVASAGHGGKGSGHVSRVATRGGLTSGVIARKGPLEDGGEEPNETSVVESLEPPEADPGEQESGSSNEPH
jgi:hypothetical protein